MLPPSFQTTLLALEGKLRQLQTLERTVLQAAALDDADVAYCTASQLADACEQAVLLARALPACTGRPHVFFDTDQKLEPPTPVEVGFTREGWFSLRMPMLLPKKERGSAAFVRMLLLPALRRFFQGKPRCGSAPACWCSATSMPGTAPTGLSGTTTTSRPTWPPTAWPSTSWRMTTPPPAASMNAPPKETGSVRKSMWCPRQSSPSGCCRKNPCRRRGWSFCNIGRKTEKSLSQTGPFFHGPFGTG